MRVPESIVLDAPWQGSEDEGVKGWGLGSLDMALVL